MREFIWTFWCSIFCLFICLLFTISTHAMSAQFAFSPRLFSFHISYEDHNRWVFVLHGTRTCHFLSTWLWRLVELGFPCACMEYETWFHFVCLLEYWIMKMAFLMVLQWGKETHLVLNLKNGENKSIVWQHSILFFWSGPILYQFYKSLCVLCAAQHPVE